MKRAPIIAVVIILALIGGTAAFLRVYKQRADAKAAASNVAYEPAETVAVTEAREITWYPTADLVGTVLATQWVNLSNEVPGAIKDMNFESGSIVEKGQELIHLDDSTEQANLATAQATVRSMKAAVGVADARLHLAEADMRRLTDAIKVNAAVEADLDKARATLDEAKASKDRATADAEEAQTRVDQVLTVIRKKVITAPFRGRVGLRNIHPGQYLKEGMELAMLQEVGDTIYLDFAVPQEYVPRVLPGMTVKAEGAILGPAPVAITVVAIDATVNNETRNVRVRSRIDNKDGRLRPGMFVAVKVPSDIPSKRIVVPLTAVRRQSFADHVFVLGPGKPGDAPEAMRARQQYVKLGPSVGEDIIVLEGLKAGDKLAAGGSFKLHDGGLVMKPAPAAPGAPIAPSEAPAKPQAAR